MGWATRRTGGPRPLLNEGARVVAGRHDQGRRGIGTDAEEIQQVGHGGEEEGLDPLVELGQLVVERADPMRQ